MWVCVWLGVIERLREAAWLPVLVCVGVAVEVRPVVTVCVGLCDGVGVTDGDCDCESDCDADWLGDEDKLPD